MSVETILYLILGAAAGGFVNGLAGTGTALFSLGFYLAVLDPVTAVAIVALMSVLAGLQGVWIVRGAIMAQSGRMLRFLLPGLAGLPVGVWLLSFIDTTTMRLVIAALLIIYGGYFSARSALPSFSRPTPWIDTMIGGIGGVLGGAAGVSGALPTIWLSIRPWTKTETRAVLQPFNVVILSATVALLFAKGAYDAQALGALIVTIPCGMIAAQIGIAVFKRLSDTMFRRLLIGLAFLMGLGILAGELL